MKKAFVISLLISGIFSVNAQDIKVHKHVHSWVGGACCHGGSETTVTVKIPKGEWQQFDSLVVCTGPKYGRYALKDLAQTTVGDTLVITAKHSYRYNQKDEFYYIQNEVVSEPCNNVIYLLKGYVRKELTVTSESESMVAYP